MTLQQIIEEEKEVRCEAGMFGISACKEAIEFAKKYFNQSYYELLEEYVERANKELGFNKAMVLACWELINEQ